jgi:hypothetical protein
LAVEVGKAAHLLEKSQSDNNLESSELEHRRMVRKVLLEKHVHLENCKDRYHEGNTHDNAQIDVGKFAGIAPFAENAGGLGDVCGNSDTYGDDWHLEDHSPASLSESKSARLFIRDVGQPYLEPLHSILPLSREEYIPLVSMR